MMRSIFISQKFTILTVVALAFPYPSLASTSSDQISSICESAAELISRESGVPLDVLRAISLTETGRRIDGKFQPWPWTVNMEGIGKWFKNVNEAQNYVDRHFARGARSFDVGCFQINYRWHGTEFSSIEEMFDPISNTRYAAKFLKELHDELGDWAKAAGAYHSRTPKFANKYRARFSRIRKNLPAPVNIIAEVEENIDVVNIRTNSFPLLRSGQTIGSASLVPLAQNASTRFIDISNSKPIIKVP